MSCGSFFLDDQVIREGPRVSPWEWGDVLRCMEVSVLRIC